MFRNKIFKKTIKIEIFSFALTAQKAPDFVKKPTSASGPVGGQAKFEVQIDGEPEPEVKW